MAFRNMGTFNAPAVRSGSFSVPMGGAAAQFSTTDAAGLASSGAFLISELEKRDPKIREPLTSFTYPRDLTIEVGGGWVDGVSAMDVGYGLTGGSGASPVAAGGANAIPVVQASVGKNLFKAHAFAVALRIMYQDMQKANFVGRPLDSLLQRGVRMAYDKHMDENIYVGIAQYGSTGLINNPDVVVTTVAQGAGGTTPWSGKTADEILKDVNDALTAGWAAAGYDQAAVPNHIIMPWEQYTYIMNTKVTDLADKSILTYIEENNVATKIKGEKIFIGGTEWCKAAGASGKDRMVVYCNHSDYVKADELVPLQRVMTGPNAESACYDSSYMANISEVQIFAPETMIYVDGI